MTIISTLPSGIELSHIRSYADRIASRITALASGFLIESYGTLQYGAHQYDMLRVKVGEWTDANKPAILITGGVHGYEEAGPETALHFLETTAHKYADHFDILVYPCISPAGYETDSRSNLNGDDTNRGFREDSTVAECRLFIDSLKQLDSRFVLTIDLHESLSIEVEREQGRRVGRNMTGLNEAPDSFYLYEHCADHSRRLGPAIIEAVAKLTPVCDWPEILGDTNTGGVLYPEGMSPTGPLTTPINMEGWLVDTGYTSQAFTTETYGEHPLADRIAVQMAVIETALNAAIRRAGK